MSPNDPHTVSLLLLYPHLELGLALSGYKHWWS